jgi:hypothetical protein
MKKLVVIVCLPFIIFSCASMGTNLGTINSEALNSIRRVGIAPYTFSNLPDDISKADFHHIIEICDSTIIKNMKKQSQIEEILKINTDTL